MAPRARRRRAFGHVSSTFFKTFRKKMDSAGEAGGGLERARVPSVVCVVYRNSAREHHTTVQYKLRQIWRARIFGEFSTVKFLLNFPRIFDSN